MNENFDKVLGFVWETLKIIIVSLFIIIPIRYYIVQPFFVQGASMEPNFENGEYLLIDEISWRFRAPERGEVTVFKFPGDKRQFYIKRIIGLPNETLEIKDNKVTIFNVVNEKGFRLDESVYLSPSVGTQGDLKIKLREKEYFVMGDNRQHSSDSRRWGVVPKDLIIGRAWLRAFPFDRLAVFSSN